MTRLLAVLTLVLLGSTAIAGRVRNVLIEVRNIPKEVGITQSLRVFLDGEVLSRTCESGVVPCESHTVTLLTKEEVDVIKDLIRESSRGRLTFEASEVLCFTVASSTDVYTADNRKTLLRKGAVCDGGFLVNDTEAARILVDVLDILQLIDKENERKIDDPKD